MVTDQQAAVRLVAHECQPFQHIIDHVIEDEPGGIGCLRQMFRPAGKCGAAIRVENTGRAAWGHRPALPRLPAGRKRCRAGRMSLGSIIAANIAQTTAPIVDLIYPPRCPLCGGSIAGQQGLCGACWSELRIPGEPSCAACQRPFGGGSVVTGALCAPCLSDPPMHDEIAAGTLYNPASRKLVLAFKHGRRIAMAPMLARLIAARLPPHGRRWADHPRASPPLAVVA